MKITYAQIKALDPCYDPSKFIPVDYEGTLIDILKMTNVPVKERLWIVVQHTNMTDKQLHLYGLACARMAEQYTTDLRVKECNDTTEAYINGRTTIGQLIAAESAAWSAWSAAWSAAESAAWSAAESAAWSAAWSAAESAAWSAWSAAWSSESAACSARLVVEEKQCLALIKILETK